MGIKVILITIVFLLEAFSITTASRKIDCQNLSLLKNWTCDRNYTISMSFTIHDKSFGCDIQKKNSSDLETFYFYILKCSDGCSSEWFDKCADECSGEWDDKCSKCGLSYGPKNFALGHYNVYDISTNQYIQFIVKNKFSPPQVCCVHFRNQEEETFASPANNSLSVNIATIPGSGHLDIKIICLIISVVVCCFGILAGLIYLHQRNGTRNIPEVPLPEVENKPKEDIRFLFIYDSNDNLSFKEIVRILQNIIKNTEKCEVVDLWEELNDIATLAPHNWFQNHIKVKNFKVVLLLNRQIMNYMVNTNTSSEPPQDTLGRSMICFFSQFFYHLPSDQLITISILNPPSPDSLNGSKLYILPDHFKELVYDFGCGKYLDDEAMRKQGMKLAIMCKQYIEG